MIEAAIIFSTGPREQPDGDLMSFFRAPICQAPRVHPKINNPERPYIIPQWVKFPTGDSGCWPSDTSSAAVRELFSDDVNYNSLKDALFSPGVSQHLGFHTIFVWLTRENWNQSSSGQPVYLTYALIIANFAMVL